MSRRETFVVIHSQNIVAVTGYACGGIGLARRRPDDAEESFCTDDLVTFNAELIYEGLRAFHDGEGDEEISFLALIVVIDRRGDFHIEETVGKIYAANGICIVVNQLLAKTAIRTEGSGLKLQSAFEHLLVKIFVAGETDASETIFISKSNLVADYSTLISSVPARSELNVGIEIALALKIIAEIAAAFLQQIFVHGSFRINR